MKHDSYFHPLKVTLAFLAVILLALLLGGCGLQATATSAPVVPLNVEGGLAK